MSGEYIGTITKLTDLESELMIILAENRGRRRILTKLTIIPTIDRFRLRVEYDIEYKIVNNAPILDNRNIN